MFSFCCRRSILYQKQNDIRWFKVLLTHTDTHFVMSMWQLLHLSRFVRFWTTGLSCCFEQQTWPNFTSCKFPYPCAARVLIPIGVLSQPLDDRLTPRNSNTVCTCHWAGQIAAMKFGESPSARPLGTMSDVVTETENPNTVEYSSFFNMCCQLFACAK